MNDYISRVMAIARLTNVEVTNKLATMTDAKMAIAEIPAADVATVVHGRWVQVICHEEFEDGFVDRVKECCSVCHAPNGRRTTNYCPDCGADMRGINDE